MKSMSCLLSCASFILCMLLCAPATALIMTGGGEGPVRDAGWPVGAVEMANLPTRFAWYEGPPFGGDWHFRYRGDTAKLNEALTAFSKILSPRLELIVVDGRGSVIGKPEEAVDWEFQIWIPESYYRLSRRRGTYGGEMEPSLPPPRVTAYLGKGSPIEWAKVQVPANVSVVDKRVETSPYKDSQGGVVRITAYDMATGKIIPGVDVVLKQYEGKELHDKYAGRTDDRGAVVIRSIASGYYYVTLRCQGYAPRAVNSGYKNWERTLETYDALLAPVAGLSGTVTDLAGAPLADVNVRVSDPAGLDGLDYNGQPAFLGGQKVVTDANGHFEFGELPRGSTRLFVWKDGYSRIGALDVFEVPGKAPIEVKMDRSGTVRGKVTTSVKMEPGQQIMVSFQPEGDPIGKWGGNATCNPDGTFEVKGVATGRYTVTAKLNPGSAGKHEATATIEVKPGETLEVELKLE